MKKLVITHSHSQTHLKDLDDAKKISYNDTTRVQNYLFGTKHVGSVYHSSCSKKKARQCKCNKTKDNSCSLLNARSIVTSSMIHPFTNVIEVECFCFTQCQICLRHAKFISFVLHPSIPP
jgi:hypothetical protein